MMSQYQDKKTEFAAYRMMLAGVNLGLDMLIVLSAAIAFPQISSYAMCLICLAVAVITLVFQIHIDHTLIFSGQFLVEDGEALYAAIGIAGLGFGKRHRQNRRIHSYRHYYIENVKNVDRRSFGIRVKADVYTASDETVNADKDIFEHPGSMKRLLMEKGKKKTAVFRIEHNLTDSEEARLLEKLESLKQSPL